MLFTPAVLIIKSCAMHLLCIDNCVTVGIRVLSGCAIAAAPPLAADTKLYLCL
ncbi:hypothetical protein MYVALT_E_00350 [Candidatus Vallotia tarda]|uniref:Uncharacterized protein n=1 Tax=Candidatus Vallotiella hemipterorum TaxID=1177213 RepID=A0A916NV64_9BURK|nr:hypothetical protein MYVALT_E_00350 [Candidatus Vallotia tarda]